MKYLFPGLLTFLTISFSAAFAATPVEETNLFIGTGGHGHTYPGATVPFGFVQLSPDTPMRGWDGCSGYHYSDDRILGFSHTHLSGTGIGDLGDVILLPVTGELQDGQTYRQLDARLASRFSHDQETASPGYYAVTLDAYRVRAELTATAHVGVHRYTFPANESAHVIVDLVRGINNGVTAASFKIVGDHQITGSRTTTGWNKNRTIYFALDFSQPFIAAELEAEDKPLSDGPKEMAGKKLRAALDFGRLAGPLVVRAGLSAVSAEQAMKNLRAETPTSDFDAVRAAAGRLWDEQLSRLTVDTPDPELRTTFYTALYHTMLAPTLYNDADGTYRGPDGQAHAADFQNYSTFSFWDTFRAEHPLLTLIAPERVNDFVRSTLAFAEQSPERILPKWPLSGFETRTMIGYHAVPVVCDAYLKGFRGFDAEKAFAAVKATALSDKNAPSDYDTRGYVAAATNGKTRGAARTLEYAYDDWCIARFAEALGRTDDRLHFDRRAGNYANVFDATAGFFRSRTADGGWRVPFDPKAITFDDYAEANAWQYAFFVPHDVPGMVRLYGGAAAFIAKLDACFDQESDIRNAIGDITGLVGQYSHGNEPCHHMAYLYALAGDQDRTARRVRQIVRTK